MDVITRNCPRCNAPLEVELAQSSLECGYCGCAVEVVRHGRAADVHLEERTQPARRAVPCPESLQFEEQGGGLTICWRWFSPVMIFLAFFCLIWDSSLLVWYGMAAGFGGFAPGPVRLLMFLFPLVHVAVGAGLTYFTIAGFLNTTRITIDGGTLRVTHAPLPWKQPPPLPVDDIDRAYVTQSTHNSSEGRTSNGYAVNVLDRNGRKTVLVNRMTDSDKALCIADRIRRHLNLDEAPVAGEYTG